MVKYGGVFLRIEGGRHVCEWRVLMLPQRQGREIKDGGRIYLMIKIKPMGKMEGAGRPQILKTRPGGDMMGEGRQLILKTRQVRDMMGEGDI